MSDMEREFLESKHSRYHECVEMLVEGYTEIPCPGFSRRAEPARAGRRLLSWSGLHQFLKALV